MLKFKYFALLLVLMATLSACKSLDCGCPMSETNPERIDARPALDYIYTEFPNASIEEVSIEVESGWEFFDVGLYNGVDVYFTADGTFACSEDDDDEYGVILEADGTIVCSFQD